jgi:hypothetical protein
MYLILQQRFRDTLLDASNYLLGMALDPRLMPGVAAEMRTVRSSASTPSLRTREGSITPIGRMDAPGGNVRVVVRVREFLPRGKKIPAPLTEL